MNAGKPELVVEDGYILLNGKKVAVLLPEARLHNIEGRIREVLASPPSKKEYLEMLGNLEEVEERIRRVRDWLEGKAAGDGD